MAKQTPSVSSAEVLVSGKPSRSHQVIGDFRGCPIVPPEILREWLEEYVAVFTNATNDLHSRKEDIGNAANTERLQASSIVLNSLDFLEQADGAFPLLNDEQPPEVSLAFTHGLRLGMLHEKLMSLADGRYRRIWKNADVLDNARPSGAKAEKKERANTAMEAAKKRTPSAKIGVLKKKAAEELGIKVRTLNRWLK